MYFFTFENCKFENSKTQFVLQANKFKDAVIHYLALKEGIDPERPEWEQVYNETDLQALLKKGVPNKEVAGGEPGGYWTDVSYNDKDIEGLENSDLTFTLNFKNCTIGGEAITKDKVKFPTWGLWAPEKIKFKVIIDGIAYNAVTKWYDEDDSRNGTVELMEME